ncbi:MAG: peptidylprolyl isomerase [bacterium]|nr:peptidylprolyl isomerase [bacterium]
MTSDNMIKNWQEPPLFTIDRDKQYIAELFTSGGNIKIELFTEEVPVTVNNFVFLAQQNFYDNTKFHRVIKNFMIQGGDPKGDGTGGPGYRFPDESIARDYKRGIVAMANAGPDTNGSQFFIMHQDYPLPKNYVIFGQVIDGWDVLDAIADTSVTYNGAGELSLPLKDIVLEKIVINAEN